jgi:hypothetical protein
MNSFVSYLLAILFSSCAIICSSSSHSASRTWSRVNISVRNHINLSEKIYVSELILGQNTAQGLIPDRCKSLRMEQDTNFLFNKHCTEQTCLVAMDKTNDRTIKHILCTKYKAAQC